MPISDSQRLTPLQTYNYNSLNYPPRDSMTSFDVSLSPEMTQFHCSSGTSHVLDQPSHKVFDACAGLQFGSQYSSVPGHFGPDGHVLNAGYRAVDCSGTGGAVCSRQGAYYNYGTTQNNNTTQTIYPSSPSGSPQKHTSHASDAQIAYHTRTTGTLSESADSSPGDPYSNVMVWLNHQACGGTVKRKRKITCTQRSAANVRERRRMTSLNHEFEHLREQIPMFPYEKKPSRIRTLKMAMHYISFMTELIHGKDNPLFTVKTIDSDSNHGYSPSKSL